MKVIGRPPGERSCLSLVWAVLDRASRGWRGVDMNPANVRLLQQLRADLFRSHQPPLEQTNDLPEPVPAVAQHHFGSPRSMPFYTSTEPRPSTATGRVVDERWRSRYLRLPSLTTVSGAKGILHSGRTGLIGGPPADRQQDV